MSDRLRAAAFGLAGSVFVLDRVTKRWIEENVSLWDTYVVIPNVFNIVHARNRGAAFGFLAESPGEWRSMILIGLSLAVAGSLAVMLWQALRQPGKVWTSLALSLVLGGAVGNIYDRIATGSVTDFLQVFIGSYEWPSFNVADSAISTGVALLLVEMWRGRQTAAT